MSKFNINEELEYDEKRNNVINNINRKYENIRQKSLKEQMEKEEKIIKNDRLDNIESISYYCTYDLIIFSIVFYLFSIYIKENP